jgi:hypothetical protein
VRNASSSSYSAIDLLAQVATKIRVEAYGGCLHERRDSRGRSPVKAETNPEGVDGTSTRGRRQARVRQTPIRSSDVYGYRFKRSDRAGADAEHVRAYCPSVAVRIGVAESGPRCYQVLPAEDENARPRLPTADLRNRIAERRNEEKACKAAKTRQQSKLTQLGEHQLDKLVAEQAGGAFGAVWWLCEHVFVWGQFNCSRQFDCGPGRMVFSMVTG